MKVIGDEWSDENKPLILSILPPLQTTIGDTGKYKSDRLNGEAKSYYQGKLVYEGKYKNGNYNGKGKLYFESGKLKYEGEFKKGRFHGKGTLYKEDGSVVYKGAWENGDVK